MTEADDLSFFDDVEDVASPEGLRGVRGDGPAQYLIFVVAGMELAVALAQVAEIVRYERVSDVPGMPAYVRGIVHVRGLVIPVFDLAIKLGRAPQVVTKRTCLLLLELAGHGGPQTVAIVMDDLGTLIEVDRTQVRPPPTFGTNVAAQFLDGLLPAQGALLPLVDFRRVFAGDELHDVSLHTGAVAANDVDQPGADADALQTGASMPHGAPRV